MDAMDEILAAPSKSAPAQMDAIDEILAAPSKSAPAAAAIPTDDRSLAGKSVVGALQGAATVGHTFAHATDPIAQYLENHFGTLGGPSVAEAKQARSNEEAQYQDQYGHSTAALLGNIAGQTALTAPVIAEGGAALGATKLGALINEVSNPYAQALVRVAKGAGQGAAAGAAGAGENDIGQSALGGAEIGGALGAAAPFVEKLAGAGYRAAAAGYNKLFPGPSVDTTRGANALLSRAGVDPAAVSPEVAENLQREAAEQTAAGQANPVALARKANLEALGLKPTNTMLTRDPQEWAAERELAKRDEGKPLADVYAENNNVIKSHLASVADKSGGAAQDAYDAGNSVINAARAKFQEWQGDIARAYDDVINSPSGENRVSISQLKDDMLPLADETAGEPIVKSVMGRLKRLGVIDDNGKFSGSLTVKNAEELRKFIANQGANDPSSSRIRTILQNSLDEDVLKSTGSDSFGAARQLARERFREIDSSKLLEAISSGDATPDRLLNQLVSKSTPAEDVTALNRALTTGNNLQQQRGAQAWNDIRQQTAQWIAHKATNGNPEAQVSYPQLRKALEQIGDQKLNILFGQEGADLYKKLLSAAHDSSVAPPLSAVNTSNTSSAMINSMRDLAKNGGHVLGLGASMHNPLLGAIVSAGGKVAGSLNEAAKSNELKREVNQLLKGTAVMPVARPPINPMISGAARGVEIPAAVSGLQSSSSGR